MMDRDKLHAAVANKFVPEYATNYSQVKEQYQEKYGQRGWIGALAQALTGSEKRSGKEYLTARRSIERFESGQFKSMKKYGTQAEMARVGRSLPPIGQRLPGNKITLTVDGKMYDRLGERPRTFTATWTGTDAYDFANNPDYTAFFRRVWPSAPQNEIENLVETFDSDTSGALEVTSVS